MDDKTYGALKRIVEEVKEKRKAKCIWIDCVVNNMIGGNDIDLVENWIDEIAKDIETKEYKTQAMYAEPEQEWHD